MGNAKVITSFGTNLYSDTELTNQTNQIGDLMSTDPQFSSLSTNIGVLKGINENLQILVSKALNGDHTVIAQKKFARIDLENQLKSIALQVQTLSDGDELVIRSAGFDVKRKSEPVGELDKPTNLIAVAGSRAGTINVSWNVVPNALMYEVAYTPYPITPNSVWIWFTCSKHTTTIEDIPELTKYCIKVAGAGSDPRRDWSDIVTGFAK